MLILYIPYAIDRLHRINSGDRISIDRKFIEIAVDWKINQFICNDRLQGKCLCGQLMRARLRRAGMLNRKVTQRLRTILDIPESIEMRDVFPALNAVCEDKTSRWVTVRLAVIAAKVLIDKIFLSYFAIRNRCARNWNGCIRASIRT